MKKIFLILIPSTSLLLVASYFIFFKKEWKKDLHLALSDSPTMREKKEKSVKRTIASTSPQRENRLIVGTKANDYLDEQRELNISNQYSPEWAQLAIQDMHEYCSDECQVSIKAKESIIELYEEKSESGEVIVKGRYREIAVVQVEKPDKRFSFRAMFDSETGKMLETWDQSVAERRDSEPVLIPSGMLESP